MWQPESAGGSFRPSICGGGLGGAVRMRRHHLRVSTMAALQLLFLPLVSCMAASAHPPGRLPPCQVVQMDVFCSNLRLRGVPVNLPRDVQTLDLSRNQVQNLSRETLGFHTGFHRLNLHANKIHFIQPGLFKDMPDLRVLDLSRNHLSVFAVSKVNVGPLYALKSLDLSGNGFYTGMSDSFLADSPSLESVSLSDNSITKVTQDTFRGLLSLKKINLHNNVILEIEDGAFDFLQNLTELDLSKNSITCIKDFNLNTLKVLNLSKNSLEDFQSTSPDIDFELVSLDLSENKILYFPLLPKKNVLEHLDISRNRIQTVTESLEKQTHLSFEKLRYLDMSYNNLKDIPERFFRCMTSLEILNMSHNCISSFSITNESVLQKAKVINLSYNSLQSLHFKKNTLHYLRKLYLQGNDLKMLDQQIFQSLPNIRHLQLQENNLRICSSDEDQQDPPGCVFFHSIHSLRFLNISENNLRTLPSKAFENTPLRFLDLSLNPGLDMQKGSLYGLEDSLAYLLLKESNLSSLNTELSSLRSLRHVDLSTNQLDSLPLLNKESSIESLNLQNNNLVTLDQNTIVDLERSLKTLYMGSNPLSCCENLGFLHIVRHSTVTVPDLEMVTCSHQDHSEPVNIGKVTQEMCRGPYVPNYTTVIVVMVVILMLLLGLLVKCCHLRRQKHSRSFSA
uniref:Leucine rich repeat containing 32 n=2 Tax=Oryzias latipes TaxID=8090 RepID=A0A3P9KHR6_ORYLA